MKLGVIGVGVVGGAVLAAFSKVFEVIGYDVKGEYADEKNLARMVSECEVIFVCAPSPTNYGRQDISAVNEICVKLKVMNYPGVVCLKSTVLPGTTRNLGRKLKLRMVHNPEFLTAAKPYEDFMAQIAVMLGGAQKDCQVVSSYYEKLLPEAKISCHDDPAVTEIAKYLRNNYLTVKVALANEFAGICEHNKVSWDEVKDAMLAQGGIERGHWSVPGPDGKKGYSGMCLVPGTLISTPAGVTAIEMLRVGDTICDEVGETTVEALGERYVEGTVAVTSCGRTIQGSLDHIHLVMRNGNLEEVLLSEVKTGDWLAIPQPSNNYAHEIRFPGVPSNHMRWWPTNLLWTEDLAYILGLWCADGCSVKSENSVAWSLGTKKDECRERLVSTLREMGLNVYERYSETEGTYGISKVWTVRVRSAGFWCLLEHLGVLGVSSTKRFPKVPTEFALAAVAGWLDGDGCVDGGSFTGFSRSTEMIADIDRTLLRVGIMANISKDDQQINIGMRDDVERLSKVTMRLKPTADRYVSNVSYASPNKRKTSFGWITKVSKVEAAEGGRVISMETASGKYIANGILTHNCFPKDIRAMYSYCHDNFLRGFMFQAAEMSNQRIRPHDQFCNEVTNG